MNKLLFYFLFFMLSVHIVNQLTSTAVTYIIIMFFLIAILIFCKSCKMKLVHLIMIITLFLLFLGILIKNDFTNIYNVIFLGAPVFFYLFFSLKCNIYNFVTIYMEKFAFVALTFLFSMILIDYILIINGMSSYQLLFKSSYLYGPYATKPLGLFGQFSINSTYAVFFYLLYLSFSEIKGINSKKVILFLMTSFIIIVENSGSGYISFLLMIFVMIYNKLKNKLFLIFLTSISIFILIYFNLLQKISLKYISFLIEKVFVDNLMMHFNDIKTPFDLLLGTGSQYMDFGPLYIIGSIGLIVFLIYTLVLIYFLIKVKCLYMKTAIMSLILGNIHYPTLFFPIMNVLLPILFIYYINKHTMKNMIDNNV